MSRREQKRLRQLERRTAALEKELAEIREYMSQPVVLVNNKAQAEEPPPKKGLLERLADALKGE